jgi:hypothetical protein
MTDKTTMGIVAEPEEVEAVLQNLCGYHLSERDPVHRYTVLTREQVLYDALVAAIRRERGRALAELVGRGHKLTEVADLTGLGSRQRVQRLIQLAQAAEAAVAEVRAASLDFEERLAAVEATLDEVVSGLIPIVTDPGPVVADPAPVDVVENTDFRDVVLEDDTEDLYEPVDPYEPDVDTMFEPTQAMPALSAVLNPTMELSPDEAPWWRRNRDTGAA